MHVPMEAAQGSSRRGGAGGVWVHQKWPDQIFPTTVFPTMVTLGAFSHSARTAPIITVIIQVTTLKTTHLRNHAQSIQNSKIQISDACHGSQGPKFCPL